MSEGADEQVLGEQSLPRQFRCTNLEMTVNLDVITLPMQFYTQGNFLAKDAKLHGLFDLSFVHVIEICSIYGRKL